MFPNPVSTPGFFRFFRELWGNDRRMLRAFRMDRKLSIGKGRVGICDDPPNPRDPR